MTWKPTGNRLDFALAEEPLLFDGCKSTVPSFRSQWPLFLSKFVTKDFLQNALPGSGGAAELPTGSEDWSVQKRQMLCIMQVQNASPRMARTFTWSHSPWWSVRSNSKFWVTSELGYNRRCCWREYHNMSKDKKSNIRELLTFSLLSREWCTGLRFAVRGSDKESWSSSPYLRWW